MAQVEQIIIDVNVEAGESARKLGEVKQRISELKNEQKKLQDFIRAGVDKNGELSAAYAENAAELKKLAAEEKMYTGQLNIATQGNRKYGDSLAEQGQLLTQLKNEYRSLSEEQRKSAGGEELKKQIAALDASMKSADAELGDFQRNVGHYENALNGLGGRTLQVANLFKGGFKPAMEQGGAALKTFGKTLLTTPVGWIAAAIGALVSIFGKLKQAFKQNDDAGTALSRAMATFKPILTAINGLFVSLAKGVSVVVEGFAKVGTAVLRLIPSFRQASDAARDLVTAQDELEESERKYALANAENEKKISENNAKIADKARISADERKRLLEENAELEKKNAERNKQLAAERYRIAVEEAKQNKDTSDETKNRINDLKIAMIQAQTEYSNSMVSINKRTSAAIKEIDREEEERQREQRERWKEAAEARKAAKEKEVEEIRKAEDIALQLVEDESEKSRQIIILNYTRQINDLRKRLTEETNLTKSAKVAINQQIVNLEKVMQTELNKLSKEALKTRFEKEIEIRKSLQNSRIAAIEDETSREIAATNAAYEEKINALRKQLQEESNISEEARENLNENIMLLEVEQQKKIAKIREKAQKEAAQKEFELAQLKVSNYYEKLANEYSDNELKLADLRLNQANEYYATLLNLDAANKAALFENEEAYKSAVIAAEGQIRSARKASNEAMKQEIEQSANTLHQLTSSISDVFDAVAGDSEAFEKFKKTMAIADAAISLGQAIAAAVSASTAGDPYTMAIRIAANVAAVTASFASLIASIKAATIPAAPSFEQGGIVPGNSLTGDNVRANVNSREMILTMKDQQNLLQLIRAGVPTTSTDYRAMAEAMKEALKSMPSPVLDYKEFTNFEKRVKTTENIVKL